MKKVRIEHPQLATQAEARQVLLAVFPGGGTWYVKSDQRVREVSLSHGPEFADDPRSIFVATFPAAGSYSVARQPGGAMLKAAGREQFTEWWLERLLSEARTSFTSVRALVLKTIERFIQESGGHLTDVDSWLTFESLLFDLRQGVRWSAANPLPAEVVTRLKALGFQDTDVVDFAGMAYRMGVIERQLRGAPAFVWADVLQAIQRAPISHIDEAAMTIARATAGQHLTPIALASGIDWHTAAATQERELLRTMTAEAIATQRHPLAHARDLYKRMREEGIYRDWERVARTEMQGARLRGAFEAERTRADWRDDTQVYRAVAAVPCNACLRLYKNPDGTPRLYTVAELVQFEALGPNRGPQAQWHPTISGTHPNCLCFPWAKYVTALDGVFRRQASHWAPILIERGLAA